MDENKNTPVSSNNGAKKPSAPPIKKDVKTPPVKKAEKPATASAAAPKKTAGKGNVPPVVQRFIEVIKANKKIVLTVVPIIVAVVITAVVLAVVLKNGKDNGTIEYTRGPVYATDENGIAITDENGMAVTITPETEIVKMTDVNGKPLKDANGKTMTTIRFKDYNYTKTEDVTDKDGETVTDKNGAKVTEKVTLKQDPNKQTGNLVMGTTAIAITDGQGHTALDKNGNVLTTIAKLTSNPVTVAPASLEWKASMGGTETDYFSCIDSTNDGYIAVNVTNSKNGNMTEFEKVRCATPYSVIVKYDDNGNVKWRKAIGSVRGPLVFEDVIAFDNGVFYAIGYVQVDSNKFYDGVVYKFDKKGNEIWHKYFSTTTVDTFNGGVITSDGGIVVVGSVGTNDGDAAGFNKPELKSAACIVKYKSNGELEWKNIVGGNRDTFRDIAQLEDGSLVCVGTFNSNSFFKNRGKTDAGVVKFTSKGKYVAATAIAGKGTDVFTGITACKNGGFAVVGRSDSSDTDATKSMFVGDLASRGGYDAYIMKYNNDLSLVFAKPFRGQYDDDLVDIIEKEDGTFVATGCSNSSTRDFKGITTRGGDDIVIASFDKNGNLSWARSFGGTADESASAICLSKKDGYVIAGRTLSKNIDMVGIAQYVSGRSVGVIAKFPE